MKLHELPAEICLLVIPSFLTVNASKAECDLGSIFYSYINVITITELMVSIWVTK